MILYPAIDIRDGRAVRLTQGDYERETVFDDDPLEAARRWVEAGARALHVVDLDGAVRGESVNVHHLERIAKSVRIPVQFGGGIRDSVAAETAIAVGAARVVLGTAALTNPDLVGALVDAHGDRVMVAIDSRAGRVAHSGWTDAAESRPTELVAAMGRRGVVGFVYTEIEVDGTLEGPRLDGLRDVAGAADEAGAEVTYSGGIGSLDHLRELARAGLPALAGVIVGRALYERRFSVAEAQETLSGQ